MATTAIELNGLAKRINDRHRLAMAATLSAAGHYVRIGELLIEAKDQIGHGEWESWVESACEFSPRQAQKYIRFVKFKPEIESKSESANTLLTLEGSLALVAEPKPKYDTVSHLPEPEPNSERVQYLPEPDAPDLPKSVRTDGHELTEKVTRALASAGEWEEAQRLITQTLRAVKALPCREHLGKSQQIEIDLRNAREALKFAAPHAPCSYCGQAGCKACKRLGWLPKSVYDQAPEQRETA